MPKRLVRYQKCGGCHFLTFSCYRRMPLLGSDAAYRVFESELEAVRRHYGFVVAGYVLMPEHVHLLVSEPRVASLAIALQVLKRNVPGLWSSTCSGQLRGAYGPPRIGLSK